MMSDGLNSLAKSPFSPGARVMSEDATITFLGIQDEALLDSDPGGDFTVNRIPGPRIGSSPVRHSTGNLFGAGRRPPAAARWSRTHRGLRSLPVAGWATTAPRPTYLPACRTAS